MQSGLRGRGPTFSGAATDPERMRAVMTQHLRAPGGPPVEVVACSIGHTRRNGSRNLIHYDVTLRDPADGREWSQAVGGVAYGGQQTRKTWERLRQLPPPTPGPAFVRAAYVSELDLLLQVFPFDHQLPALQLLMAGPLPGLVDPLLAQFSPGSWQLVGWEAESVRYRVDLRSTVRLSVRARETGSGETAEQRFFAKVYDTAERVERAWGTQRDVAVAITAANAPVAVPRLVAYLPEARVLVQSEVQGISLYDVLLGAEVEETLDAVQRTARAVAALHQLPIAAPPHRLELGRTDPERLRRSAERLRTARPELASLVTEVETGILGGLAAIGELSSNPIHGDLRLVHVVVNAEHIILLDLDKFAAGDPMLDVINMLTSLGWGRRSGPGSLSLAQAFVEEYFAHVPEAWELRLAPHYAWALLEQASRDVWALEEAQAVLAGRPWWAGRQPRIGRSGKS
jgi:aminoglycoside phosphotransferase (APT) family kinase protein